MDKKYKYRHGDEATWVPLHHRWTPYVGPVVWTGTENALVVTRHWRPFTTDLVVHEVLHRQMIIQQEVS